MIHQASEDLDKEYISFMSLDYAGSVADMIYPGCKLISDRVVVLAGINEDGELEPLITFPFDCDFRKV